VAVLVGGVAALAVTAMLLPLRDLPEVVTRIGPGAPVAGVVVGAALLLALVPRTPISVACGLIFGAGLGALCALAVTAVAATATFAAGRLLGRDFVERWTRRLAGRRVGRAWNGVERWIAREGTLAVAAVRAMPVAPYGLVGYAYGASAVRVRHYALGSALAGSPSAVTYALLGAAIGGAGSAGPLTVVPLTIGVVLTVVVGVRTRRHVRRTREPAAGRPGG
jgi:uncharacterized membrane protein YdjX (TVP38/TMEM64 family)